MNKSSAIWILLLSLCASSYGQLSFPSYYETTEFAFASPGALKFGLYGYDNPALLTYLHQPDLLFTWSDAEGKWSDFNRWGIFAAVPNFGFAVVKTKTPSASVTDYRLSTGFGERAFSTGLSFGWSGGDRGQFGRSNTLSLGTLVRPSQRISFGLVGTTATSGDASEAVADVAARPLANELVTVFADYAIRTGQSLQKGNWSAGVAMEPLSGIRIIGRYFDTKAFAVGVDFSLGRTGLSTKATYDRDGHHNYNTYGIRLGAYDRTVLARLSENRHYLDMNLNGPIKHQRFILFDNSNTLARILSAIDDARIDPAIAGIAINTSGLNANREMLWEVRDRLRHFKSAGKKVVIFIDTPSMDEYHFASVADRIVLDPTGLIVLEGYVTGRTFLKGTLEKLGIGFDEWRFFAYKSANESFSRETMSEPDREQRQKLVDDFYRLAKAEICQGRNFSSERFDQLVNDDVLFLASDALEKGLVDTLGRWEEVRKTIENLEGETKSLAGAGSIRRYNLPGDNRWGTKPRVAIIYALGVCAMDEGITARKLVKDVEAATDDARVKAIVLRVDSPGGDGMASDYIAEALRKAKKKKPVIVSQGYVAASGGYWLSMYADTIVAAPNTITGSIGVIGGWFYNTELKEKLGFSTDHVKAGKHADLGFGFSLPFLGIRLPDRNLTEDERGKMERGIKIFYKGFVEKVASGRRTEYEAIEAVAQGRVWSGYDGKEKGLIDVLGGLQDAIRIAREKAGIGSEEDVEVVEYPGPGLINPALFMPKLLGMEIPIQRDKMIEHLIFRMKHNGQPLPVMSLDEIELEVE